MIWLLFMFMLSSGMQTEGGNITSLHLLANTTSQQWVGVIGNVYYSSLNYPSQVTFNTSGIYRLNLQLSASCKNFLSPYLFFANTSYLYFPLKAGNISRLQSVVNGSEGANNTLLNNTTVIFPVIGTVWNVPYIQTSNNIPVYFLEDLRGNIVFIAPIYDSIQAYNGQNVNYQIMLPLLNRSPTTYYIFFYYSCVSGPGYSSGGSSWIPILPKTQPVSPEPVYLEPSCTYYVSNCEKNQTALICEIEGCGNREKIYLPITEPFNNTLEIKEIPTHELSYKQYVKQIAYTYIFPSLIVLLTAALALTSLFVVIFTLPQLGIEVTLPFAHFLKRK